eukprot:s2633_g15.t1
MRLRMAPIVPDAARGWPRTETRVVGMLLQALPEDLHRQIVASRRMSADQIMFKLYTVFQPGGQTERTSLLQMLVDWKSPSNNAADIADSIRNWGSSVVRAEELQIVLPDPLVMAGVVAKMSDVLVKVGGAQVGYRLASVRQHLGIDLRPGMNEIRMFSELLQAEAEELSLRQQGVPAEGHQKEKSDSAEGFPSGKRGAKLELPINAANVVHKTACRNWLTDKGCQYADKCRFVHPLLTPKMEDVSHVLEKGIPGVNVLPEKENEPRESQSESEEETDAGAREGVEGGPDEETVLKTIPKKEPIIPEDAHQVVQEVNLLLKGLKRLAGPMLKSVGSGGDQVEVEAGTGLLDGGATHPLRQGSSEEIKNAVQEEGDHGNETDPWEESWGVACKCVADMEQVTGMPDRLRELAKFKKTAMEIAIERSIQVTAEVHHAEAAAVLDQQGLGSLKPLSEKNDAPGQQDHPEKEGYEGILKQGTGSTGGSSKPKRVKFWDITPSVLKVLRVQDHYGHAPQAHSHDKEGHLPKIINESGRRESLGKDHDRSTVEEHRAAADFSRSGLQEMWDHGAARRVKEGKESRGGDRGRGRRRSCGREKERKSRSAPRSGRAKEKHVHENNNFPGKDHQLPVGKINSCRWKRSKRNRDKIISGRCRRSTAAGLKELLLGSPLAAAAALRSMAAGEGAEFNSVSNFWG